MLELELIGMLKECNVIPRLENGKLKLVGDVKSLDKLLIEKVKASKEELIAFLTVTNESNKSRETIVPIDKKDNYPLSNAQKRMWVLNQFDGGNRAYNIPATFILEGVVNFDMFEKAVQVSVVRHDSLRTSFHVLDSEPIQVILDELDFKIEIGTLPGKGNLIDEVESEEVKFRGIPFDLENAPLLRIKLLKVSEEQTVLLVNMHHIISDGWSSGVLIQEIMHHYRELCQGNEISSDKPSIQYKDYVAWLNEKLDGEWGVKAKEIWANRKLGEVDPINLPIDYPRSEVNEFEGSSLTFVIPKDRVAIIEMFSRKRSTTIFNFFRATLSIALHKWTNQNELILGTPVAGRSHYQLEDQIGLFVNTLPMKSDFNGKESFSEYFNRISKDSLETFEYQDYPLDAIIEEAGVQRDTSRNPLFDVMFVVQNNAMDDGEIDIKNQHRFTLENFEKIIEEKRPNDRRGTSAKFDLNFSFHEEEGTYKLGIVYKNKLFKRSSIQAFFKLYDFVLDQVIANENIQLESIEVVDEKEKETILKSFNKVIHQHSELSIQALLKKNLETLGTNIAIHLGDEKIDYRTVNTWSDSYAVRFRKEKKDRIGLLISRSEHILYSTIGAFKANKTYVPIDRNYPENRIEYILQDAGLELILVDDETAHLVPFSFSGKVLRTSDIEEDETGTFLTIDQSQDPAYVIYTSGSTGKPKGVEITHKNAIAFLKWCDREFSNTPYDIMYAGTSYCFDLSIFEMFVPLLQGKSIRILNSGLEIDSYVPKDQNIFINTVPSVVRNLLDMQMSWKNVVALNMAGEPVPVIFKDLLDWKKMEVRNLYGPSEDTTYSTMYRFEDDQYDFIPIGRPVGDTQIYILNSELGLQPIGTEGEICLSGESIAKGYLNRPILTAEKFLNNPFLAEKKLYRTGDIGKWMPDGQVAFIGRMDDQVKVRGYRIELGEIQYQLEQINEISEAVVIVSIINDEATILAYYELNSELSEETIVAELSGKLPAYMVPNNLIALDEIPKNANGKVDKKRLPLPKTESFGQIVLPKNDEQRLLVSIWEEVLGKTGFGITQDFFDLGGHSLKATRLKARIQTAYQKEMSLNELFQHTTIVEQVELIEQKGIKVTSKIETASDSTLNFPLSLAQQRLWVLTKFEDVSKAYHMPAAFEVKGTLDVQLLGEAVNRTVEKHESLRTVFREVNNEPRQVILASDEVTFSIEEHQVSANEDIHDFLLNDWKIPFDLENGPLMRCSIVSGGTKTVLSFNMHHIISDGWSLSVLFKDVLKSYSSLKEGGTGVLEPLEIQYKDFAIWQRNELSEVELNKQLDYWVTEVFSDGVSPIELPTDASRPAFKTYNGASEKYIFSKEYLKSLNKLFSLEGASLFMGLLANVNVLLKKLSNQDNIIIGTPVAGRGERQLESQIGFFVNTLPIKSDVNGKQLFTDLLRTQRSQLLKAFDFQYFPFEMLVEELQPKRDMSRSPIFDVMVVLQNFDNESNESFMLDTDIEFSKLEATSDITKYDLTFSFSQEGEELHLELEYNTDLFRKERVKSMIEQLGLIFEQVIDNPNIRIDELSIISVEEKAMIAAKSDNTNVGYDKTQSIVSLFQDTASKFPGRIALKVEGQEITFHELDQKSSKLSKILVDQYNVKKEDLIVLHTGRTEWMIVGILATLKAGGAYVPVDPEYPASRIEYILSDSGAKLMLMDESIKESNMSLFEGVTQLNISTCSYEGEGYVANIAPDQLAYIIYTSGTTGNPKGVLLEHRNVSRLLFNQSDLFDFDENDKWTLFHSYCFDFSVWEMYGAILKGGTLVIVPKLIAQDSNAFFKFLTEEEITVLNQTPTAFRSLATMNEDQFSRTLLSVRYVIFGGEALAPATLKSWNQNYPSCKLINMYGITETTVHVTYKEIGLTEITENKSNIGVPIPTLSCYVLDKDLSPCAIGVTGELFVGGSGVARGYHNKVQLTEEKFIDNPFDDGTRLYRSGDFARILDNGDIEYIGRKDDQVKVRGHRIELAEVEQGIKELSGIKDVVVVTLVNELQEHELIAYVLISNKEVNSQNFRTDLQQTLPSYMIPSQFIVLEEFPLTRNGKLDKKALPSPREVNSASRDYIAPRNQMDEEILEIWKDVLGQDDFGIEDNFFDLGGHSLKATRVISRIQEKYAVKVDLKDLFTSPNVKSLSDYVETVTWMNSDDEITEDEDELIL